VLVLKFGACVHYRYATAKVRCESVDFVSWCIMGGLVNKHRTTGATSGGLKLQCIAIATFSIVAVFYAYQPGCSRPSVRLSVKRVKCDKIKVTSAKFLTPRERTISFSARKMVGRGQSLVHEILGQTDPVPSKTPIFSQFSLVTSQP